MNICLRLDKNSKFDNDKHRFGIRVLKDTEMNYFFNVEFCIKNVIFIVMNTQQ